jgi:hypothetical protein
MDNLSTDSFINSRIGALEWGGDWKSHGDAALEAAAGNEMAGPPTGPRWTGPCCGRIDDAALEAAGANLGPPLTAGVSCGTPTVACPRFID